MLKIVAQLVTMAHISFQEIKMQVITNSEVLILCQQKDISTLF